MSTPTPGWRNGASGSLSRLGQVLGVDVGDGVADEAVAVDAAIVAVVEQAAFVAAQPKAEIALPALGFDFIQAVQIAFGAEGFGLPDAEAASLEIGLPETEPIGTVDAVAEPAVDHHQVFLALPPIERRPDLDGEQIDDEELDFVLIGDAHQQIGGVQIVVQDAGIVNARDELSQFHRELLPQSGCTRFGQLGQDGGKEVVQRDALFEAARDENALAGTEVRFLLRQGERIDRRNTAIGGGGDHVEFDAGLARPDQMPQPGALIVDQIVLDVEAEVGELDAIDDAVRAVLDDACLARFEPFGEAESLVVEQLRAQSGREGPAESADRLLRQALQRGIHALQRHTSNGNDCTVCRDRPSGGGNSRVFSPLSLWERAGGCEGRTTNCPALAAKQSFTPLRLS